MISLHEIPDHVSAIAAVASIGTGRTTMVALDLAKVSEDDVVLVTAAASGMGNLLVRAAELLGRGGRIVSFGWASEQPGALDDDSLRERGIAQSWVAGPKAAPMGDIRVLETRSLAPTANGVWSPLVNPPYKLAEAAAAHSAVKRRGSERRVSGCAARSGSASRLLLCPRARRR